MSLRLIVATALLGSLVVLLSQLVFAYTLEDQYGFALTRISLLSKHGPTVAILAVVAGLAALFTLTVTAREPDAAPATARVAGIVVAGMGVAVILVFFLVDLPDVGSTGMFNTPGAGNLDATGSATGGLWMELIGGIILLLAGIAFFLAGRDPRDPGESSSRRPRRSG